MIWQKNVILGHSAQGWMKITGRRSLSHTSENDFSPLKQYKIRASRLSVAPPHAKSVFYISLITLSDLEGRETDRLLYALHLFHIQLAFLSHTRARAATFGVELSSPPFSVDAKLERKWKQAGKQFSLWYKEGGIALIVCGSAQRDAWGARYLQEGGEMSDAELHPANYTHYAVSALHT